MGLRHGAKQLIDQIEAHEAEGLALLDLAAQRVKYNPDFAIEKIRQSQEEFRKARKLRDEQLPAMLQKAAPPLERRVDELEARIARLERPNVTQFSGGTPRDEAEIRAQFR